MSQQIPELGRLNLWRLSYFLEKFKRLNFQIKSAAALLEPYDRVISDHLMRSMHVLEDHTRAEIELILKLGPPGYDTTSRVTQIREWFTYIHQSTGLLPMITATPHTLAVLKGLSVDRPDIYSKIDPIVALSSDYSFGYSDLSVGSLRRDDTIQQVLGSLSEQPVTVLSIPRAEAANPLAWVPLIHELGHAVLDSTQALQTLSSDKENRAVYNFLEEIAADLFGLSNAGNAYLLAFIEYAATFGADLSERKYSYPSPFYRICCMMHVLNQTGADSADVSIAVAKKFLEFAGLPADQSFSEDELGSIVDPLWDVLKETHIVEGTEARSTAETTYKLYRSLKEGIPVGSLTRAPAEARAQYLALLEEGVSESELVARLEPVFVRGPNSIRDIFTAGWLCRFESTIIPYIEWPPQDIASMKVDFAELDSLLMKSVDMYVYTDALKDTSVDTLGQY